MATNRIDILDPALLRPGRIDRKIEFPNPNESSRADILRIHSRKMNLVRGIDLRKIADKMTGASGAELKVCPILLPLECGNLSFTISVQDCGAEPVQECVHLWEEHSKTSAFSHGWGQWCMGYAPAKRGCKASHACSRQSQDLLTAGQKGTTTQIKSSWQCARTRQCARTKYSDSCICFAGMLHRGWHVCAQGKKGTCHSGKAS